MIVCSFSEAWFKIQSFTLANLSWLKGKHVMCTYDTLRTHRNFCCFQTICPSLSLCSQHSFFPKSCCSGQVPLELVHFKPKNRPPDASVMSLGCIITSVIGHQSAVSLVSQHQRPFLSHCWTKLSPRRAFEVGCQQTSHNSGVIRDQLAFEEGEDLGTGLSPVEVLVSNQARWRGSASASYLIGRQGSRRRLIRRYPSPPLNISHLHQKSLFMSKGSSSACIGSCGELQRTFVLEISLFSEST